MSDQPGQARGTEPAGHDAHHASSGRFGRRALMLGAAATGAGVAASVAGGGIAEGAATGHPVLLGKANTAHGTTQVTTSAGNGLQGQTSASGNSGVVGFDTASGSNGHGVYGHSIHGSGVLGVSQHATGVTGFASTSNQSGVAGIDQATTSGGHGVFGQSQHGNGVFGNSQNGVALHGNSKHGLALQVQGKAKFSQSGVTTVSKGHKSVTVSLPGVTPSNIVLATIQRPLGNLAVAGAQAGSGSFTITLTGTAGGSVPVGWMVIE
ncbi:MAG TPA: hypothetical protein VN695_11795 [Streptosporangiaceae bacterium]|nr:hypothetical protein [Streptosporangiaceae bacterium]